MNSRYINLDTKETHKIRKQNTSTLFTNMVHCIRFLLLAPLAALVVAQPRHLRSSSLAMHHRELQTIRDNYLVFSVRTGNLGVWDVSCSTKGYSITDGQPWAASNIQCYVENGNDIVLLISAGRQGSSRPADWFKDNLNGMLCSWGPRCPKSPDNLNFAAELDITVQLSDGTSRSLSSFKVGQDGRWLKNEWRIGRPSCDITPCGGGNGFEDEELDCSGAGKFEKNGTYRFIWWP